MGLSEKIPSVLVLQNLWLFKTAIFGTFVRLSPWQPEVEDNRGCEDAQYEDDSENSENKT